MDFDSWLVMVAAIAGVIAISAIAMRWSLGRYAEHRRVVAESDRVMQAAARDLGLRFLAAPGYDHPVVGTIPPFGLLRGSVDGVDVTVSVDWEGDEPVVFHTVLRAAPGPDFTGSSGSALETARYRARVENGKIVLVPTVKATGSVHAYVYHVVVDPVELRAFIAELIALARASRR